jgi:hypothetical protein
MAKKKSSKKPAPKSAPKLAKSPKPMRRGAKATAVKASAATAQRTSPADNKPASSKRVNSKPGSSKPAAARKKAAHGKKRAATSGEPRSAAAPSLGRPTITAEEKLFMLFHDDFHARQIFEFLRAETVGDLEKLSPHDIIHRLSRPIRETVDRIRRRLAGRNRCLAGDEPFAVGHQAQAAKNQAADRQA